MNKEIKLDELNITIPADNLEKYFNLIETLQKNAVQDTYLLMDNLFEENASCIDTYSLFLYLKKNGYKAKYVLYEKNRLYKKLKETDGLEDIIVCSESITTGTDLYEKLFSVLIRTKYIILSFPSSLYPSLTEFAYKNKRIKTVCIGHGPVFFKTSILDPKRTRYLSKGRFNLYLVSSRREKEIFMKEGGWPANRIFNIGLPRFDWCQRKPHAGKNIFIMFTWRLRTFFVAQLIDKLQFFKSFNSLLNNKKLRELAETEGYNVIIGMHHAIKDQCGINLEIPSCYKVAETDNLIEYINTADLFITDYSSIVHDFMFLHIPVIFYRLDYGDPLLCDWDRYDMEESRKKDGEIFNVFYDEKEVIDKIIYYKDHDFVLEDKYIEIEDSFFTEKKDLCQKFTYALENYREDGERYREKITEGASVMPVWPDVKTAVCVGSSNEYAPYLSVYLTSLIANSSGKKDIIVFEKSITDENKEKLMSLTNEKNVSIRFVDPSFLFKGTDLYISHDYFAEECYYRVAAPKLLSAYDKIIYTDLDMIAQKDILELANIDMHGHPVAACVEPLWQELYICNSEINGIKIQDYTNNILQLSSPFIYYNTGIIVFDVKEFNRLNAFEGLIGIIRKNNLIYQEQCALNIFFKDSFYTLPAEWNYELYPSIVDNKDNFAFYNEYKTKEKNAGIFHFLGKDKPWKNPAEYKAELWWSYARKSPFYEEIAARLFAIMLQWQQTVRMQFAWSHLWSLRFMKWRLYLCKCLSCGKRRDNYRAEYKAVRNLLRTAGEYKHEILRDLLLKG